MVDGTNFLVERIIYALHYEVDPGSQCVRHLNDDPTDNSKSNLALGSQRNNSVDNSLNNLGRSIDDINISQDGHSFKGRFYVKELDRYATVSATTKEHCRERIDAEMAKYNSDPSNYIPPCLTNSTGFKWVTMEGSRFRGGFTHKGQRTTTALFDTPQKASLSVIAMRLSKGLPT